MAFPNNLKKMYPKKSRGIKSDYKSLSVANTRHLKRILIYLDEVKYANSTKICKEINITMGCVNDALLFLSNHGIIMYKNINIKIYYLAKNEKEALKIINEEYNKNQKEMKKRREK
jgi:hypothetical protein